MRNLLGIRTTERNIGKPVEYHKENSIKQRPLKNPRESLDERIRDVILDHVTLPLIIAVLMLIIAGLEWYRYVRPDQAAPFPLSLVAIFAAVYAGLQIRRAWSSVRALKKSRDGEKTVGQNLQALRDRGYHVFHDIAGDGFNLDHVLIGPAGIFTIETKTHSKPLRGNPAVIFDGDAIPVNGLAPDRNPVVQGKAQASWLAELLAESTGRRFTVKPVIVYPGRCVEHKAPRNHDIWVIDPKGLPAFLDNEPAQLSAEEISLASFHLSRLPRTAGSPPD